MEKNLESREGYYKKSRQVGKNLYNKWYVQESTNDRYVFNTYTLRTRKYFLEPAVEWILVEEKKECGGVEVNKGTMDSIAKCAKACSGVASMFIFGTNDFGVVRCFSDGCKCVCETAAKDDGSCDTVDHKGFRLYEFGSASMVWSLVEETKECGGQEISKGNKVSIDECAKACSGVASMFALGTNDFGVPRCYADGCTCLCETGAKDDGICDTVDHKGYNLYRFGTASK